MQQEAELERQERRRTFHSLDMLRGVAAIAVVGRHLNRDIVSILPSSHLAVDLFFVLSGFVLCHAYQRRLTGELSTRQFIKLRLIRLYPLYILGTLFGLMFLVGDLALGAPLRISDIALGFVMALFFIPAPLNLSADAFHAFPFNFPAWSLFWELVINAAYAVVARYLSSRAIIAILVFSGAMLCGGISYYGNLTGGSTPATFALGGLRVLYSFVAGIGVYRVFNAGSIGWFRTSPLVSAIVLIVVFAIRPASEGIYDGFVALFIFPALVLASTREPSDRFIPFCTWLGLTSYPMYALHGPFSLVEGRIRGMVDYHVPALGIPLELCFVASMVLIAWLAERWYDRPARALLSQWTGPHQLKLGHSADTAPTSKR